MSSKNFRIKIGPKQIWVQKFGVQKILGRFKINLIWTNVARTNVAWTNVTVTVGICSRGS